MEILKCMTEDEISGLRETFEEREEGLDSRMFEKVLLDACAKKPHINTSQLRLRELFLEIDSSGDGYVNWDEFTMFIIHRTDGKNKAADGNGLDGVIKNYQLTKVMDDEIPKSVIAMSYIPRINKVIKVIRQDRGQTKIRLCNNDMRLSTFVDIPRFGESSVISHEYIPPSNKVLTCNCLIASYNDSMLRLFDVQKRRLNAANEVRTLKEIRLVETQTSIKWSKKYERVVMGSRTGIVSVQHPDESAVSSQEKLHNLLIADMALYDQLLFTASLDPNDSVKCVDLQRSVVRYVLNDHPQGATLIAVNPVAQTLFSAGFEMQITSHAMLMPRVKPWKLFDSARPHHGRITHMQLVPNTPQLISSDTSGLTKIWDIRMNSCVQNITPPKDDLDIIPPEQCAASSLCVVAPSKRIIISGRNTGIYCYEGAVDPAVADLVPAHIIIYNESTQTFLTVHQRTVKQWEVNTGELRSTFTDLLQDDITAACIVPPLDRKLFFGTVSGRIVKVSFALCDVDRELSEYVQEYKGEEVSAMVPLPSLRESMASYVVVGFKKHVVMVPDVDAHSVKGAHAIRSLIEDMPSYALIKCMRLCRSFLLVGASDGCIRMVDLSNMSLVSRWAHKGVLRGDILSLSCSPLAGTAAGVVSFCSDGGGDVLCGVTPVTGRWETVSHWDGTDHCEVKIQSQAIDDDHFSESEIEVPIVVEFDNTPTTSRIASPVGSSRNGGRVTVPSSAASNRRPQSHHSVQSADASNAVEAYLNPAPQEKNRLLGSCVVFVHHCPAPLDVVVTADEKGSVSVWDCKPLLRHTAAFVHEPLAAQHIKSQPRLIRWWKAHEEEIISMIVFPHRETQQMVIMTGSNDQQVILWSLDGAHLGNLAIGRDDSGILVAGVQPYLYQEANKKYWEDFNDYLAANRINTPPPESVFLKPSGVPRRGQSPRVRSSFARESPLDHSVEATTPGGVGGETLSPSTVKSNDGLQQKDMQTSEFPAEPLPPVGSTFLTQSSDELRTSISERDRVSSIGSSSDLSKQTSKVANIFKSQSFVANQARLIKKVQAPAVLSPRTGMPRGATPRGLTPRDQRVPPLPELPKTARSVIFDVLIPKGDGYDTATASQASTGHRITAEPPPAMRITQDLNSKKVIERCRRREGARSPEEYLRRSGKIIICVDNGTDEAAESRMTVSPPPIAFQQSQNHMCRKVNGLPDLSPVRDLFGRLEEPLSIASEESLEPVRPSTHGAAEQPSFRVLNFSKLSSYASQRR